MKNLGIKISLFLNYFVFAILLNSVGIVILKSQNNYGVGELDASILEAFKDLPIAIVSFVVASFLPRIGYKKAMLAGLAIVTFGCIFMYYGNSFDTAKILFALVGVSFALIKVSVYTMIGLVTSNAKEHNSFMSTIEGVFMLGIALAYFLFPAFNSETNPDAWLNVYWLLAGLTTVSFVFLLLTNFDEKELVPPSNSLKHDLGQMFKLFSLIVVMVFLASAFTFVMIEQGIMTWLPTFNEKVLKLPESIGIMMASIFAISLAVGRLLAGVIARKISWLWINVVCVICAILIAIFILPQAASITTVNIKSLSDIPAIGFAFPLIGLFIAPIYPLLNSVVLSAIPKSFHSPMTGLIVLFSALGGTVGSRIMGWLFETQGPQNGFYFTVIPMVLLIVLFFVLKKMISKPISIS